MLCFKIAIYKGSRAKGAGRTLSGVVLNTPGFWTPYWLVQRQEEGTGGTSTALQM